MTPKIQNPGRVDRANKPICCVFVSVSCMVHDDTAQTVHFTTFATLNLAGSQDERLLCTVAYDISRRDRTKKNIWHHQSPRRGEDDPHGKTLAVRGCHSEGRRREIQ